MFFSPPSPILRLVHPSCFHAGSPFTFLSAEVFDALGLFVLDDNTAAPVVINGVITSAYKSHGRFAEVNLLGGDFFEHAHARVTISYLFNTIEITQEILPTRTASVNGAGLEL